MVIVTLGGSPGVGKSSVVKEALKYVKGEWKIVNYGAVMLEFLGSDDHDIIRKQPVGKQQAVQLEAAKKIKKMAKHKNLIVDTHYVIWTGKKYLPGLPPKVLNILNPKMIIYIQCPVKELIERRRKDKSRRSY